MGDGRAAMTGAEGNAQFLQQLVPQSRSSHTLVPFSGTSHTHTAREQTPVSKPNSPLPVTATSAPDGLKHFCS